MAKNSIQYLQNQQIDYEKWDRCIANAANSLVYAESWYLDRVCPGWDALVLGDYLYVMPLPVRKKLGLTYSFQPFFTQQLGVFSPFVIEPELANLFIKAIPSKFRLIDIQLNIWNHVTLNQYNKHKRQTYLLSLSPSAEQLREKYTTNTRRNIKKAIREKLHTANLYDIEEFIRFTRENLSTKTTGLREKDFRNLQTIIAYAFYHRKGEIAAVYNNRNQLIAATFFLFSRNSIIYLAASSSPEGIEKKAMFLLIDNLIASHARSSLMLDFEGSMIPGIARFYEGFGASAHFFQTIRINRLPGLLKKIKA